MTSKRQKNASVDILDKVLATISLPHSVDVQSLKANIDEQLRLLIIKAPLKQLGKDDSIESRKLVLLESILRASQEAVRLPSSKLAAAVGMKKTSFEALSSKVGNYIDVTAQSTKSTQKGSPRNLLAASPESAPSTIPALSIRLGSQVHDSHGFARRAEQLLQDMEEYIQSTLTLSKQQKKGYLIDMKRSRAAYEAVAFYVVAQGRKLKHVDEEEEDETQLSIQNIVDASAITASDFRDVLPTVMDFASLIAEEAEQKQPARKESARSNRKRGRTHTVSKESKRSEIDVTRALLEGVESAANDETRRASSGCLPDTLPPRFVYSKAFLEWKKAVLEKICEETNKVNGELVTETNISDSDVLRRAADEVLQRNGMLDPVT